MERKTTDNSSDISEMVEFLADLLGKDEATSPDFRFPSVLKDVPSYIADDTAGLDWGTEHAQLAGSGQRDFKYPGAL
ncbi:MAG: hypothetical protein LBR29_11210 [Methylobacteriaceae bacterium]|nr:hypothetical protein [Methylobacteriaceae bacterium]